MNSKEYWNNKIIEWENSMRGQRVVSPIEKLAIRFRSSVKTRAAMCLDILKPFVKDKTVLDIGCGSGYSLFTLHDMAALKHGTGIDISFNAIARARTLAADKGLTDKFDFIESDGVSVDFPNVDYVMGLGFFDYLETREIKKIFDSIKGKNFLFTFSERKFSVQRGLHIMYLLSQQCPKHFYYTKEQISDCIPRRFGEIHFVNDKRLAFGCIVHNLPVAAKA